PASWQIGEELIQNVPVVCPPLFEGHEGTVCDRTDVIKLPVEPRARAGTNIDVLQEGKQPITHGRTTAHPAIEVEAVDDLFSLPSGIQGMDLVAVSYPNEHICER